MIPREGRARDQDRLAQRDNDEQSAALDLDLGYALSLGLVFWVGEIIMGMYKGFGIDLAEFQGNGAGYCRSLLRLWSAATVVSGRASSIPIFATVCGWRTSCRRSGKTPEPQARARGPWVHACHSTRNNRDKGRALKSFSMGARQTGSKLSHRQLGGKYMSLGTILIIILILVLLGVIPTWGHSRDWGYGPSGIVGLIIIILLILLLLGKI